LAGNQSVSQVNQSLSTLLVSCLAVGLFIVSVLIFQRETQIRSLKEDLIELQDIKYGLFNVDTWKEAVAGVVTKKIREFELTDSNRKEMRIKIHDLLTKLIDDLEASYEEEKSKSFGGWLQLGVAKITDTFGQMRKEIPNFTNTILGYMEDPANKEALRKFILAKMEEYATNTFQETDYTLRNAIIEHYGFDSQSEAIEGMSERLALLKRTKRPWEMLWGALVLSMAGLLLLVRSGSRWFFVIASATAMVLLGLGLVLPMIEIDARISRMSFTLLGEPMLFENQVLYYKSKSILEVVRLMMTQERIDLLLVGFLVLAFSVLFPLSKLVGTGIWLFRSEEKPGKFLEFIVFRSGKWSMADVMVVAIFMAYIGFSGIISEQLKLIESITIRMEILTTNHSGLLFGFFSFAAFAVVSLLISQGMQRRMKHRI
jgi:hypothetical protein